MCNVPEGYGNIDRIYDFGFDSVPCSAVECGARSFNSHFACHFLSKAGRSSLRALAVVVESRVKVVEGRLFGRRLGRAHRRACATKGVNRISESVCMMMTGSSCQHLKNAVDESGGSY